MPELTLTVANAGKEGRLGTPYGRVGGMPPGLEYDCCCWLIPGGTSRSRDRDRSRCRPS